MQHYQKNILRILKFCETCNKRTMHTVVRGRVSSCENSHAKGLSVAQQKRIKQQGKDLQLDFIADLFDGRREI